MSPRRRRLDVEMTERGLAPSRARAQALILAGRVLVDGQKVDKAGAQVLANVLIKLLEPDHPWVSRGGLKLVAALEAFELSPEGLDCLDVGASTGGFTHVLLERGAERVVALDVGRAQLDWRIRSDSRVTVMEGVNARHLGPDDLPFEADAITIDVSFISLQLIVPAVLPHLKNGGWLICLVKPQFEAGKDQVGKGGIVRDEAVRRDVIDGVVAFLGGLGLDPIGVVPSPVRGQKGNLEEFAAFRKRGG